MELFFQFYLWLGITLFLVILELIFTSSFALLCFAAGSLFVAFSAYIGFGIIGQGITFAAFSLLSFIFIRPFLIKHLNKRSASRPKTNAHALIGKRARIVESIEDIHHIGRVVIDGDNWQARATEGTSIQVGEQVIVESIDSIILTVRRANEPSSTAL